LPNVLHISSPSLPTTYNLSTPCFNASDELHKELATYALKQGVDKLYVVGKEGELMCKTFGNNCEYALQGEHLAEQIAGGLTADVNLLIKGSRSAAMEQYVAQLGGSSC
jgi:UDP-N-acetylmuramoyl-tripeptide--D-alanyl-D-alanine ligase